MAEITVNEWLKQMALNGFNGKFTATNGTVTVKGEIVDGKVKLEREAK